MTLTLVIALSIRIALTLPLAYTPLTLGAWILSLAILFSIITAITISSWFGFILFIIYVRGMLVIFSYFAAISPNQQLNMYHLLYPLLITFILSTIYIASKSILPSSLSSIKDFYLNSRLTYIYSTYQVPTLILLATLLLLVLVLVVKIVEHKKGPLRPFS